MFECLVVDACEHVVGSASHSKQSMKVLAR
jgi:hypothetical protein